MATARNTNSKTIGDLTECSICLKTFKRPKGLPCFHTFCLKCLEEYGKDEMSGEKIPCPLCRKLFKVPRGGFKELQNNFFIQQLLDRSKSSAKYGPSDDTKKCEICSKREATKFCVDCSQDMCDSCLEPHSKLRSSQSHKVITQTEKTSSAAYARARPSYCEKHTDKPLELYCNDCQLVICLKCSMLNHKTHFTSDLQETSSTFANKLKDGFPHLFRCIELNKTELRELQVAKETLFQEVLDGEKAIKERGEKMKRVLESQVNQLLSELETLTTNRLKEIKTRTDEVERQLLIVESFPNSTLKS